MPVDRFYVNCAFVQDQVISIQNKELKHMLVMRIAEKEIIELINGKHVLALAEVLSISKSIAKCKILETKTSQPSYNLILAQSLFSFSKMQWMVEKAVELGVSKFWFFPSKLSSKKSLSSEQKKRLQSLFIAASKQCGRLDLPTLHLFSSLQNLPEFSGEKFLTDLSAKIWLKDVLRKQKDLLIFTGPEKGLTKDEMIFLEQNNFKKTKLSFQTLRAETAAVAAVSIVQHQLLLGSAL